MEYVVTVIMWEGMRRGGDQDKVMLDGLASWLGEHLNKKILTILDILNQHLGTIGIPTAALFPPSKCHKL